MPKSLSGRHFAWNFSGHETNTASNSYGYFYHIAIDGIDISLDFRVRQHKEGNDMMSLQVGESVVVKSGILDPDFSVEISGWQGRIEEVDDDTVFIRWDSITLRQMSMDLIIRCENEDLDWEVMALDKDDIEISTERDSEADVNRMASQLKMDMMDDPRLDAE